MGVRARLRFANFLQNVANLQEKKRDLAEIVLSKKALKSGEASHSRLMASQ